MLSNFIKKLLFARQFYMNDGNIEVMKIKQVMLSSAVIHELNSPMVYNAVKENIRKEFHEIANNFGSERTDLLKSVEDIFEVYGLGKLEISKIDENGKSASLNLFNSSIAHAHNSKNLNSDAPVCFLTSAVIAGIFSFLFDDDVNCTEKRCFGKGDEYCEFVVKRGGR